jgi:hypothetical protein
VSRDLTIVYRFANINSISYFELPGKSLESEPDIDFTKLHVGNKPLKDFSPKKIIHLEDFPSYDEGTEEWKKK